MSKKVLCRTNLDQSSRIIANTPDLTKQKKICKGIKMIGVFERRKKILKQII